MRGAARGAERSSPCPTIKPTRTIPRCELSQFRNIPEFVAGIPGNLLLPLDPTSTPPSQKIGPHGAVSIGMPYFEGAGLNRIRPQSPHRQRGHLLLHELDVAVQKADRFRPIGTPGAEVGGMAGVPSHHRAPLVHPGGPPLVPPVPLAPREARPRPVSTPAVPWGSPQTCPLFRFVGDSEPEREEAASR